VQSVVRADKTRALSSPPNYPCAIACEIRLPYSEPDLAAFQLAWNWTQEQQAISGGQMLVHVLWPAVFSTYMDVEARRRMKSVRFAAHKRDGDRGLLGWDGGPVLMLHPGAQQLAVIAADPRIRALCVLFSDSVTGRGAIGAWRASAQPVALNDVAT
jgi:hypothetical protein